MNGFPWKDILCQICGLGYLVKKNARNAKYCEDCGPEVNAYRSYRRYHRLMNKPYLEFREWEAPRAAKRPKYKIDYVIQRGGSFRHD